MKKNEGKNRRPGCIISILAIWNPPNFAKISSKKGFSEKSKCPLNQSKKTQDQKPQRTSPPRLFHTFFKPSLREIFPEKGFGLLKPFPQNFTKENQNIDWVPVPQNFACLIKPLG